MKRLNELADQVSPEFRELIVGLDDDSVIETQILPTSRTGLVDYKAQVPADPLEFDIASLIKSEADGEIRFSDLPIGMQLDMGVTEEGEFVETDSPASLSAPDLPPHRKVDFREQLIDAAQSLAEKNPQSRRFLERFAQLLKNSRSMKFALEKLESKDTGLNVNELDELHRLRIVDEERFYTFPSSF